MSTDSSAPLCPCCRYYNTDTPTCEYCFDCRRDQCSLPYACNKLRWPKLVFKDYEARVPTSEEKFRSEDKEYSGCSQSQCTPSSPTYHPCVPGSPVKSNTEKEPDTCTGNSWSPSPRRLLSNKLLESLETSISALPDQQPLTHTYARSEQELPEPFLNLEQNLSFEALLPTGNQSGSQPSSETSDEFRQIYVLSVIGPYERLVPIFRYCQSHLAYLKVPSPRVSKTFVFWGPTGTGKSKRAWEEAGPGAYIKNSRTKFWDGYQGQTNVIIDEFRGGIDISYLLTWLDVYPCRVEVKGSSIALSATNFWICSNIPPERWYPDIDWETQEALNRRLTVINLT